MYINHLRKLLETSKDKEEEEVEEQPPEEVEGEEETEEETIFTVMFFRDREVIIEMDVLQGESVEKIFKRARKQLEEVDPGKVVRLDNFTHFAIVNSEQTVGKITLFSKMNDEMYKKKIIIP